MPHQGVSLQKIALVTGSNKGIGLELVRQLAGAGARTILSARNAAKGLHACQTLANEGLTVDFLPLDVSDAASIEAMARQVEAQYGRLDILVNNAGILPDEDAQGSVLHIAADTVRAVFETNTLGSLLVSQVMIPLLRKSAHGRIVNISSGLGALSDMGGGYPAYRISKTALNAVTRMLAAELEGTGIIVNAICPGWVKTDMGGANASLSPQESAEKILPVLLSEDPVPNGCFLRYGQVIDW